LVPTVKVEGEDNRADSGDGVRRFRSDSPFPLCCRVFARGSVTYSKQRGAGDVTATIDETEKLMLSVINSKLWFYKQPIDFRKQIDGLVVLLADQLNQNPTSGQIFIFRSRRGDRVKILFWERNGFWLLYKRLEKGRFKFPDISDNQLELNSEQFHWLLSGLNMMEHRPFPAIHPTAFY